MALSARVLPLFNGDGVMSPEKHLDKFLAIYDIHSVLHDDIMVRVFWKTYYCRPCL